jgi:hypothetical protein
VLNDEVLKRAGVKSIETFISAARLRWYGHVCQNARHQTAKVLTGLETQLWEKVEREAPQELEGLYTNFAGIDNINKDTVQALASDRVKWRCMIRRQ